MSQGYPVDFIQRIGDSNNLPGAGWKIATWVADGTFSTALTTYSNATLLSANTNPIIADASGGFQAFVAAGTRLDISVQNAASVPQYTRLSLQPMISATGSTGSVVAQSVTFAETATGVSHVATIAIPGGADLLDILVSGGVLWGAGAAVLKVGDTAVDNGYFTGVNLKATDLLPGEVLSVSGSTSNWGGKNGAYLVAATGQRGPTSSNFGARYVAGSNIIGTVTVTTPSVTVGRTYLTVFYAVGQTVAPVVT